MKINTLKLDARLIYSSIIIFTICTFFAHIFSSARYNWQNHSLSQLAAQNYSLGWIMQMGFFSFGILFTTGIVLKICNSRKVQIADMLILFYGLSVLLCGIFSSRPFTEGIPYSEVESGLHYAFAVSTGMFLNLSVLSCILISKTVKERLFHGAFLMTIFISSLFVILIRDGYLNAPMGILQRIIFFTGVIWLFIFFLKRDKIESTDKPQQI
ncbi:MAG: DUF998 domain-containing protein [Patescibacteria group bacterium]|jgi:hypothetical membrane protein